MRVCDIRAHPYFFDGLKLTLAPLPVVDVTLLLA